MTTEMARCYEEHIKALETRLVLMIDILSALVLIDIRNHNSTEIENKKSTSISYAFLNEVNKKYKINIKDAGDMVVIEPVLIDQKNNKEDNQELVNETTN